MWFSYGALLSNFNSPDDGRTPEIIWGACLIGASITVLVTLVRPVLFDSRNEFLDYSIALRTGILPDGIDLGVWQRRLARSRLAVMLVPWFTFPFLFFGVLSADSSQFRYRAVLLGMFTVCAIWVLVVVYKRTARIKQLESAVRQRQEEQCPAPTAPAPVTMPWLEKQWRSNAATPMAERFISMVVMTSVFAFLLVLLADLDSVVYSDSRLSHLRWAALCALVIGVVATGTAFGDPRMRATSRTIDEIMRYDLAFRTTELPEHFDVDQWRSWIKTHRKSDAVTMIWACYCLVVGGWAVLSHPPGYHWVVAVLLAVLAIWQIRRWRRLCALNTRLKTVVERHAVRQLYG